MSRIVQSPNGHGSLKDIQLLVNNKTNLINHQIKNSFNELRDQDILWKSPLKSDDFAEYRDNDFIKKVGLDPTIINLQEFWPKRGPQWDAIAATSGGSIILVEAKANIPEVVSPGTGAEKESKKLIDKSLNEAKLYLEIDNNVDWSGKYYQYTNRLAHLYFLRIKKNIPTYLVNVYFVGDKTVNGPVSITEWESAIQNLQSYLGLKSHKLKKHMADIFIYVKDIA